MPRRSNDDNLGRDKKTLTSGIMGVFYENPNKEFNYKQISTKLGYTEPSSRTMINQILCELTKAGTLKEASRGKFKLKAKSGKVVGTLEITKTGNAFVTSEELSEDIFVSFKNLNSAFDGDTVKVSLYARKSSNRLEGEVVEVIRRARTQFVGTIRTAGHYSFMIPDSQKVMYDILIPSDRLMGAKEDQKVLVEIEEWPNGRQNPVGKVIEVLGEAGDNNTEMHAILAEYGLPAKFSEDIEREANKIKFEITDYDLKTREDFRNAPTFTIDPADAKDFDDALSFEKLDNGNYRIGVHIADVTHYMRENTPLDDEAFNRATSVYLVDRTVPMLPERLCNFLCSLRPNEEKFCFSAIFEMNDKAEVLSFKPMKTIISSDRRFAYEEAQEIIETGKGDFAEEILKLNELAKILRSARFQKGAFNFEHKEVKFVLDEDARPVSVYFKEAKEANNLIEEFMLLANRNVAELIGKKHKPFVYRVHAEPNYDKLANFSTFISQFGYSIDMSNSIALSNSLNGLVNDVKGKPEQNIIENLAVRAMAKAVYSTKNIGHYGLAFDFYTHFTSPIRRYPDVMTHRLLYAYMRSQTPDVEDLELKCKHCSFKEQQAVLAERSSIKYKQAEFLQDKIGDVFDGVISGVQEYGFFVELKESACEGLVHVRTLMDDNYEFFAEEYCLQGIETGKIYRLGDEVKVRISDVNLEKKQIDMELAD